MNTTAQRNIKRTLKVQRSDIKHQFNCGIKGLVLPKLPVKSNETDLFIKKHNELACMANAITHSVRIAILQ